MNLYIRGHKNENQLHCHPHLQNFAPAPTSPICTDNNEKKTKARKEGSEKEEKGGGGHCLSSNSTLCSLTFGVLSLEIANKSFSANLKSNFLG